MKILIAEDETVSRRVLERHLKKWGHEVLSTVNGQQAWEVLQAEADIPLLITDWMMPKMDGLELCRLARKLKRRSYLHIIMLTAMGDRGDLLEGMDAGADVFLIKPFDSAELQAQLQVVGRIIALENQLAQRLEDLTAAHQRIKKDLDAAARVQKSLLPRDPELLPEVEFFSVFDSCGEVAGDMFNVFRFDDRRVGLYILDVSGHGVEAALLSVSLCRALTPGHGLLTKRTDTPPYQEIFSPAEVARKLNRRFPVYSQSSQYFTFLYGILDVSDYRFTFTRAGHPGFVHLSRGTARICERAGGIPIGLMEKAEFEQESVTLSPGDQIVFYTDGVEEARGPDGELYGEKRMLSVLAAHHQGGITAAIHALRDSVREFTQGQPQRDDITITGLGLI